MDRDDWTGIIVSVALHALLLFGLSVLNVRAVEQPQMGFIEVDFGAFSEGRPVSRAVTQEPVPPQPEPETPVEETTPAPAPEESRPVDLPETVAETPEQINEPETEVVAPVSQPETAQEEPAEEPAPTQPIRPLGSGDPEGASEAQQGEDGEGQEETRRAPFSIEGLNRQAVQTILPTYAEQVNAVIRVRITVAPSGRVTRRIPLIKGNPALEQAVMNALLNWRFNPLPPNAPQEDQTGVVTFRFQLR
ncbi:MAG: TonB family protein [Rhodothermales bacterium]|nr:TonB family protein [Rhodothermales bacterium]